MGRQADGRRDCGRRGARGVLPRQGLQNPDDLRPVPEPQPPEAFPAFPGALTFHRGLGGGLGPAPRRLQRGRKKFAGQHT